MGANKIFACSSCVYEMAKSGEGLWKTAREVYWEGKKERQRTEALSQAVPNEMEK